MKRTWPWPACSARSRIARRGRTEPRIAPVSNVRADGSLSAPGDLHSLHLKANQLWHTDSTFLPVPALANLLQARVVSDDGGETEFVSTRAGWRDLAPELKEEARDAVLWHRYSHSRARIDPELAKQELFTKWRDQAWRALWPNPVTGEAALYIASHAYAVEGLAAAKGAVLIDALLRRRDRRRRDLQPRLASGRRDPVGRARDAPPGPPLAPRPAPGAGQHMRLRPGRATGWSACGRGNVGV